MTISEIIEKFENMRTEHGEIDVLINCSNIVDVEPTLVKFLSEDNKKVLGCILMGTKAAKAFMKTAKETGHV